MIWTSISSVFFSQSPETESDRGFETSSDQASGLERADEGDRERPSRKCPAEKDRQQWSKQTGSVQSKSPRTGILELIGCEAKQVELDLIPVFFSFQALAKVQTWKIYF